MNFETVVHEKLEKVIPATASKTVLFAAVEDTSYEVFFYSLFPQDGYRQCYEMAEDDILDADTLDQIFSDIAGHIRENQEFQPNALNIYTLIFTDGCSKMEMIVEHLEKDSRMYRVKKDWAAKYLR